YRDLNLDWNRCPTDVYRDQNLIWDHGPAYACRDQNFVWDHGPAYACRDQNLLWDHGPRDAYRVLNLILNMRLDTWLEPSVDHLKYYLVVLGSILANLSLMYLWMGEPVWFQAV
ncbi:hypothetical protein ACFH5V_27195, partial [Raoultella ornithinolytica]